MFSLLARNLNNFRISHSDFSSGGCKKSNLTECNGPKMKTKIPGPNTRAFIEELKPFQNILNVEIVADYSKSKGCYLNDLDGNVLLDLSMQMDMMPLGYNNPHLLRAFEDALNLKYIINRPITGVCPGDYWYKKIKTLVDRVSPNLPNVATFTCDAETVENCFKSIMVNFLKQQNRLISNEEILSIVHNPNLKKFAILTLVNSGKERYNKSISHSNALSKIDESGFDWPVVMFPKYKYPLQEFEIYNKSQDNQCLEMVEDNMYKWNKKYIPVIAIAVEPIQSESSYFASPHFFQKLQNIAKKHNIYLIFDESKTGCGATGKFWCHENFFLNFQPDVILFGGKSLIPGFFHSLNLYLDESSQIFEPWMGDPFKLIIFETIINFIEKNDILTQVKKTGELLREGLELLQIKYYYIIHSTRGFGFFLAFDAQSESLRDDILKKMLNRGIICIKCGKKSISIRPALIFTDKETAVFLEKLEEILKEVELRLDYKAISFKFENLQQKTSWQQKSKALSIAEEKT